jgi:hypothetical protein
MRGTPAVLLLLLAACSARSPAPSPPETQAEAPPSAAAVTTLAGEWRVAAIDGKNFNEPYALALSGDAEEIWWAPRCAGLVRSYRIDGTGIRIGPAKGLQPRAPGAPTPPVCAIGLPPRIDEVTRALDSATAIRRTPANGVEISGDGRSLLLFSQ